ncbi:unnamed protein product [Peronospora belbahrii]|uniref:RXLR phytopathogen effector protein WY-domain domain-containing protein n=1 Tax=Peronospora belbahrii TaxID=622444 RepID=A0AAU9LMC8_9STRA|nr:unnamed protein product [Peronospora belbahrii]
MAKGVSRRSDAVTSLESVSVKRHLKANAAMATNDGAGPSEERAGFAGLREFGTRVKASLSPYMDSIQVTWWWMTGRTADNVVVDLGLINLQKDDFDGKIAAFSKLLKFLKVSSRSPVGKMYMTLEKFYTGNKFLDILAFTGKKFDKRIPYFQEKGYTAIKVFATLHLDTMKLYKTPKEFFSWLSFLAQDRNSFQSEMYGTIAQFCPNFDPMPALRFAAKYDPTMQKWIKEERRSVTWYTFLTLNNDQLVRKGKKNVPDAFLNSLRSCFPKKEDKLDKFLVKGSYGTGARFMAIEALYSRFMTWKDWEQPYETVFQLLNLNKQPPAFLFWLPQLKIFYDFVHFVDAKNAKTIIATEIAKHFKLKDFPKVKNSDQIKDDPYGIAKEIYKELKEQDKLQTKEIKNLGS